VINRGVLTANWLGTAFGLAGALTLATWVGSSDGRAAGLPAAAGGAQNRPVAAVPAGSGRGPAANGRPMPRLPQKGAPRAATGVKRSPTPRSTALVLAPEVARFVDVKDWLGLRVFARKLELKPLPVREWLAIRELLMANAARVGYDLTARWDNRNPIHSEVDADLEAADGAMLTRDFNGAFLRFQRVAARLKAEMSPDRVGPAAEIEAAQAEGLYPFVLQGMGRALFGARRFADALEVYDWIPNTYPAYRQVLFERMWAAFRAGRVDVALGSVLSQRSAYSSYVLPAESYLVLGYVYKKLCRQRDLTKLLEELDRVESAYRADRLRLWAQGAPDTRALLQTLSSREIYPSRYVTRKERDEERAHILAVLRAAFPKYRQVFLERIKTMKAYLSLASLADATGELKKVQKISGREEFLERNLEIWPIDTTEEWVDEIGHHLFLGESECQQPASSS
jgi:tetratricopeptide (TPR) repeat protein